MVIKRSSYVTALPVNDMIDLFYVNLYISNAWCFKIRTLSLSIGLLQFVMEITSIC
jgi:hypothetical protein